MIKKIRMMFYILFAIAINCYAGGHQEYYTDANGFTQTRWVSDENEANNEDDSQEDNSIARHGAETVQEATNIMSNNGKAVWDKIGNALTNEQ